MMLRRAARAADRDGLVDAPARSARRSTPKRPGSPVRQLAARLSGPAARLGGVLAGWWSRIRPWLARTLRPLRIITPGGWGALVGGLAGLTLGVLLGWMEFLTIGIALLVALTIALLWTLGRSHYSAELDLASHRVQVGDQVIGRVLLRNGGRRGGPTTVEVPVGRGRAEFRVPGLAGGDSHEEVFSVATRRRAVVTIGPVRAVRMDPLSLLKRQQRWSEPIELFVHPRVVPVNAGLTGFLRDIEGAVTQDLSSSDVSFHALRDYVPGDDRRAIHWRTTARVNKLMVRQFEETRRTHLLILLDLDLDHYATPDDFETAVSAAGSLAMQAIREERDISLVTHTGVVHHRARMVVLDELSRVQAHPGLPPLRDLAVDAAAKVPDCSMVAIVTGSVPGASDLRRARLCLPVEARAFAIRCDASLAVSRRHLSDLPVLDVGSLQDLPRGIRSIA